MNVEIVKANESELPIITELAQITWNQHYPAIISKNQIDYMLQKMYGLESLRNQLEQGHHFYLVKEQDQNIGFISVSIQEDGHFIHKFYIIKEKVGNGVGARVFEKILSLYSPKEIRLTVNRHNFKSINFYFKLGFVIEKLADFDIGNGFVMNDFVMLYKSSKNLQ